jgi:hypothetical protein
MWVWRVVENLRDGVVVEGHGEIVLPEPIKRPHPHGPVGRVPSLRRIRDLGCPPPQDAGSDSSVIDSQNPRRLTLAIQGLTSPAGTPFWHGTSFQEVSGFAALKADDFKTSTERP